MFLFGFVAEVSALNIGNSQTRAENRWLLVTGWLVHFHLF